MPSPNVKMATDVSLLAGGYCIRNPCVQTHTIRYLERVDDVIKWKTKALIGTLETGWASQDN